MHRLLQGDVGSGKTVVAFAAMMQAARQGLQSALMAPTELLAEQHYAGLRPWLEQLSIHCTLLTSQVKAQQKKAVLEGLKDGSIRVCIGTHALIQEQVTFRELVLAVVDEQHRFGVAQRAGIRAKGRAPHLLVMTATPIPRTLAMTLYGDLDVSVITELPPGRQPVTTRWTTEANRTKIYGFLNDQIRAGRQAYVIYPVIEESEKSDLKAAVKMQGHLAQDIFPKFRVGLVHGRMPFEERQQVMDSFRKGEINILVSTTMIEVGIDVPNATVMLVEHAERFGLSQLHQLRGRVGRGTHRSYCILLAGPKFSPEATARLKVMQATRDGFRIAEEDLKLRGPGEFWGTRQHGLPALKIADLLLDAALIEPARQQARKCLDHGLPSTEQIMVERNLRLYFPDADIFISSG
jgi:ATP-dependent DNA helicase RecG